MARIKGFQIEPGEVVFPDANGLLPIQLSKISTGLFTGGALSFGTLSGSPLTTTTFSVTAGSGIVVNNYTDPENPTYQLVSWSAYTDVAITNIATEPQTFIAIDISGSPSVNLIQQTTNFTPANTRDYIILGTIGHANNTNVLGIRSDPIAAFDTAARLSDLGLALGSFNISGNVYSANGGNLNLDKSIGESYRVGNNFHINKAVPDITTDGAETAFEWIYSYQDGSGGYTLTNKTNTIVPDEWDDGDGAPGTVGSNTWTVQIINHCPGAGHRIEYGQTDYGSFAEALADLPDVNHLYNPAFATGITRGYLIIRGGAIDLSDSADAVFIEAAKFTSIGGASSVTSLNGLTDVTLTPTGSPLDIVDGQVLTYDSGTSKWVNETPASGGGVPVGSVGTIAIPTNDHSFTNYNAVINSGFPEPIVHSTSTSTFTQKDRFEYVETLVQFSGTLTGAGSTQSILEDTTQTWTPGEHKDKLVWWSGDGEARWITGNNVTQLFLNRPFDGIPVATEAYTVGSFPISTEGKNFRGTVCEDDRTNEVLYSRDMSNAAWVKTNMTALFDQLGMDNVASAASSILATAADATVFQTFTASSARRAYSCDIKRLVGTGTISITMDGGATYTDVTAQLNILNRPWVRVWMNQTQLDPQFGIKISTSGDKLAIDYNQLEYASGPSSRIETTTVAVTRKHSPTISLQKDNVTLQVIYDYTRILDIVLYGTTFSTGGIYVYNNTHDSLVYTTADGINFYLEWFYNTGARITGTTPLPIGVPIRVGITHTNGVFKMWLNGVQDGSTYNGTPNDISTSSIELGTKNTSYMNGVLIRYRDWTYALTDEEMALA